MHKRDFIKAGIIGTVGLIALPAFAGKRRSLFSAENGFKLPELPYSYEALEPFIDRKTMELHHLKHHAGYASSLNAGLSKAHLSAKTARLIIKNASEYPAAIVDDAGGFVNHRIFWKSISPKGGGKPTGKLAELIHRDFGSFLNFRQQFNSIAKAHFGAGWAWLVTDNNRLRIITTANHDNPLMNTLPSEKRGHPLFCLDLWEHAYYLKYQDRRNEYIDAFWNIIDWNSANQKLIKGTKA
jgi:superoxide dismutase, Fe-Mn family